MKKVATVAMMLIMPASALVGCGNGAVEWDPALAPEAFNGVILVAKDRSSPFSARSFGFANQETGEAFNQSTRSQIGSASKFLTAIVVLRLVEQNQIRLDGPIRTWLPFLSESENGSVTLRHLLNNMSGIPDGVMASYREDPAFTAREISAFQAATLWGADSLQFNPGAGWDYSLTNWVIVRAILETATGKSFEALVQQELIGPLKLQSTGIPGPSFPIDSTYAQNYVSLRPSETRPNSIPTYAAASGTFFSSAADLRVIVNSVFDEQYLNRSSRGELIRVAYDAEGYALGGRVVDLPGTSYKLLWESGETSNYRALVAYEPTSGACVILLDNSGARPDAMAETARSLMRQILDTH